MAVPDIASAKTMQLATVRAGRPWIATVYFVLHDMHFYWLSFPSRRHSEDIALDEHAAIAIVVKESKPVIGIQAEGRAVSVTDIAEMTAVISQYVKKYGQGAQYVERFLAGENEHQLYRFTPDKVMLFDEFTSRKKPHTDITRNYAVKERFI